MPKHDKHTALRNARFLYLEHREGLSDAELAAHLGVSINTANRYRRQLGGGKIVAHGKYTIPPTEEEVKFAKVMLGYPVDD